MDQLAHRDDVTDWSGHPDSSASRDLESGKVLFLPRLAFRFVNSEYRFLDPAISDGKSKNISFDPRRGAAKGTVLQGADLAALETLLGRYHDTTKAWLSALIPAYADHLKSGRTSFRPVEIDARPTSWRKDDRRLHVDAFPSQPVGDWRILRVFTNVNPDGKTRDWRLGEAFADVARRFASSHRPLPPGVAWAMHKLGLTKSRRSQYDSMMLHLHDAMKRGLDYQAQVPHQNVAFPANSSWVVYTDLVSHAALGGQHALEQTFYLPVAAMEFPELSPQRVLARFNQQP